MLAPAEPADHDAGPRHARSGLERQCALTRKVLPVGGMLRFVVAPGDTVVVDLKRKLPGRGLWLTASHAAVAEAAKKGVFARGFKRAVTAPPELADVVDGLMVQSALDALAIAGKAGSVVSGATKVGEALDKGGVAALIHASNAAPDGVRKLNAAQSGADLATGREKSAGIGPITLFSSDQLDLALQRLNVIHAAVLAGPAGKTFIERATRLSAFRETDRQGIGASRNRD